VTLERDSGEARTYGRRVFLALLAGGLSSLYWARPAWRAISPVADRVQDVLPGPVATLLPGGWRIYTVGATMPRFDRERWRLTIGGLVEQPVELSYDDLLRLPRAEQVSTFHCVTGWSVSNVHWAGVRLQDLLSVVRPLPEARALTFVSAEVPYVDSLTLAQANLPDVLLAHELDG
jgi:DMSO/TMAO reductase YedYZ molybdopterin-dependent catalytic subunit